MSIKRTPASLRAVKEESGVRFKPNPITAALLATFGTLPGWAQANDITVQAGWSGTTIGAPSNGVTDVTTSAVRGSTGFNQFGKFTVDAGNTVNLHVPTGASTLVNLVHNARAEINGTLNGLKDGRIGGNIIFADPHGMVVGASGVVNVGSLTVTTPSAAQMSQLAAVASGGTSAEADRAAAELMVGKFNDGAGTVEINGKVNTAGSINLFGASAIVASGASLQAGTSAAETVFVNTVNLQGVSVGTGVAQADGSITIVGRDGVQVSGELAALMADNSGGNVQITATNSIELKDKARLQASGDAGKNAGDVTLKAASIKLSGDAKVSTAATGAGTAGTITLSAYSDISLKADNATTVDQLATQLSTQAQPLLAATRGKAEVIIGAGASLDAGQADDGSKAGNVSITAFGFDRQMSGYADAKGSIDVAGSITGKDISLRALSEARVTGSLLGSLFSSDALKADFTRLKSANNWTDAETWSAIIDTLGDASSASAQASSIGTLGLDPANWSELAALLPYITVAIANANADVTLASTAVLKASHDIDISAETTRLVDTSTGSIPGLNGVLPFNLGVAYGRISGTTLVDVKSGAGLSAGHDLSMQALSDNTLDLKATATNSKDGDGGQGATTGFAFGMAHSDIRTLAQVADGALLNVGNDVSLTALTKQSLNNEVAFKSIGQGAAGGPAIALTLFDSTTRAAFDSDLSKGRNLNVSAINLIDQQNNSSSVQAGKSATDYVTSKAIATAKPITDYLVGKVKALFGKDPNPTATKPTESKFRLASALAIGIADHKAEAIIGSSASKPLIKVDGDVAVQALQRQSDMHNSAESTVNADVKKDDGANTSLSVAAVYSQLDQSTRALIGDGSDITAGRIGVAAKNQQLLNLNGLDRWSSLEAIYTNLKSHASSLPDVPGKLSSSYANSTSEAEKLSIAGSLSVVVNSLDSTAWVGDNVKLTATNTDKSAWSTKPLSGLEAALDGKGVETDASKALRGLTFDWHAPLAVQANTQVQQLGITGNFWWGLFNNNSDGGAAGAGVNVQVSGNSAIAGIGAGGTLKAEKLAVKAEQDELIIGISPSAGKGASVAGNGAVVVSVTDSTVHASIHNSTAVIADQVGISAEHKIGMWSAAGALSSSENTGIGASVAVNVLSSDVQALVGNNLAWRPGALGNGANNTVKASWSVNELLVDAKSSGQSGAFGVAGALAKTKEEQKKQDEVAKEDGGGDSGSSSLAGSFSEAILQTLSNGLAGVDGGLKAASDKASSVKDSIVEVPGKLKGYWDKFKGMVAGKGGNDSSGDGEPGSKLSLAIAGSGTINVSGQKNRAHLGDIVLDPRDPAKGSKVTVLSLNQTNQFSGAGGGALTLAGGKKSEFSSAIAGAVAYNHLYNVTEALLDDVTLNNNDLLKVQAVSAGDQIAMGLGLAVATAGETNVAVALSGSGAVVTNTTRAAVIDSTVNQRASTHGNIEVTAYDRSRLLIGGGSFAGSKGKGASVGGSLALGVISNQLLAEWLGSSASNFATFDLSANSAARVLAGAVALAVSTGNESSAGSGSLFVVVLNNQIKARVDANNGQASSLKGGAVNVNARSVSNLAALDSLFSAAAQTALKDSELDLDGTATAGNIDAKAETDDDLTAGKEGGTTSHDLYSGSNSGEAVLGIAGSVAGTGGKAGAGGALGVVYTGSVYKASVANTGIDLTGNLAVNASNDTQVLAAAIAAGGGNNVGVAGSGTIVISRGSVEASLDMAGQPTLKAKDLSVSALKKGASYSLAGSIAGSSQSASVGGAFSLSDMQHETLATVSNGSYSLSGDATLTAAQNSRIITAALSGSVSGSGVAVGGALTYNRIADTTSALLQHVDMSARNLAIAASQPDLGASIWSVAFNLAAAGGSAGVGAAVAVNLIDAERSAGLFDSTVNLTGDATLSSALDGEIWGLGVDAAGGNTAGVGGSIVVNNISGSDTVSIERSALTTSGSGKTLSVDASGGNGLTIASLTGSITGGGTAAVGGAISVNRIDADRTALLKGGSIGGFSTASVLSGAEQNIYAVAVAGGGAGTVAVNGSSTSNILDGSERAAIDGTTFTNTGSLTVSAARGDRTIWSLAGAVSGAGTTAVGVANANNIILAKREASISNATLALSGALIAESGGSANIRSAAVGVGGAGTAAVGGSVAVNVVDGEESASLNNVTVTSGSGVTVQVSRGDVDIKTLAGNVQGAGTAAVGAAVAVSTVDQQRSASIVNSGLTLSGGNTGIAVNALTQASIQTLAISGAGGGTAGVALSNTSNNINAVTHAMVTNSTGSASSLTVSARDGSTIESLAGGVGLGGTAGVGVATAVNRIANDIEAHVSGSKNSTAWALNDVNVSAVSDASILTSSISGAASGTAGVAAGVATNLLQTRSRALIDGGARLVAQNNVGVIAYNRDTIQAMASAVAASGNAGVSGLVTVNFIESKTAAGIGGATTQVIALGKGAGLSVDGGALQNAPDAATWADPKQFNPVADLKTTTETVRGIAIRATSLQQVGQLASSIGVSLVPIASAAVSGLSNTTVLGGSTTAYIDDAILNGSNTGASSAQQVNVGAAAHSYNFGGVVSGALSLGAAAVAATIDTGVISRDVTARISKATVTSRGETAVRATSTQVSSDIVTSAAGGIVGVGGSGGVLILKGTTQALVAPGSVLNVGALKVAASATNRLSPNTGSISGGAVGVGAGLGFGQNQSTVRAWVGQTDTRSRADYPDLDITRTTVNTNGAVNITADSSTGIFANSISASGGGVAVAGATNLILLENVTEAGARFTDFGSGASRAGSLTIHAKDTLNALLIAGSAGVGAVSVGGSANVLVTNNATRAQLLDSTAWLSGALTVEGLREVSAGLNTLNGGASANASIGGALGLLLLGSGVVVAQDQDGQSYDAAGELNKGGNGTLSLADSFGQRSNADTDYQTSSTDANGKVTVVSANTGSATGSETTAVSDRLDSATRYGSLDNRFTAQATGNVKVYQQETVARLNDSAVNAQGAATVTASDKITVSNIAGGAQLSGGASVGAAAAFTFSNAHVFADIKGGSLTAGSLTLSGSSGALDASKNAITTRAYNGAIGMGAGIGAAVAVAVMNNQVNGTLGGTLNVGGTLKATLSDDLKVAADGVGAAFGAVGAGVVLAVADRNSTVNLAVQDGASLTAQAINLSSSGKGSVSATGAGAAGGLLGAGNAVVTVATDSSTVKTVSGNNVTFNAGGGGLSVSASAQPDVYSKAIGATLGGLVGVGASSATALGDATVQASLGNNNSVLGGNGLTLSAALLTPAGDDPDDANVRAQAIAGTGGLYFAANGSVAVAKNESSVVAKTGSNLRLPGGRIQITADSATHQYADALGVAVGGMAVGASLASAVSNTHTDVILGSGMKAGTGVTVGDVVFTATADDLNEAKSVAGSGGLIAGNASLAKTDTDGEASVSVGSGSDLTADSFSINAAYSGRYGAHANSVNAAVLGGSGAGTENTLDGSSTVTIGSSAVLNARRDLLIAARNTFATHAIDGSFVSGAGGGVITGQAVTNRTTINGNALVEIGQNATLIAGSNSADTLGKLMVRAYTIQTTSEGVTLSTGGAIASGGASNTHTSNLTNTVQVDTGARLNSYGELGLGTYTLATASIEALVSTWGLAGVGVANASVHLDSNQNVTVAANALLEALGSITIAAGKDPESLWQTRLNSNANAQSTVRGLIAIPDAIAYSNILNNTRLSVATGARVLAARNINLGGYNGYSDALGDGRGRGYQLGFIPVTTNDTRTGVTKSSDVTLNGTFLAGRYNELVLSIDANGNLTQSSGLTVAGLYDPSFNPTTYVNSLVGMDATVQQILLSTLSTSATGGWILGPMFAAGGDVTIQADRLDGAGSVTANGGPKIQVTNSSSRTLVLGSAVIPESTGGHVLFTGGAGAVQYGASKVHEVNVDRRAQLLISNTYTGSSGNSSYGPAIFLTDDLFNLSGLIHISNAKGSLGQFGSTYGQQVLVEVPEGSMTVFKPSEYWAVGSNPLSEWTGFSDMGTWSANTAISLIANAVYGSGALANNNGGLLNQSSGGDYGGQSVILFGGCLPASLSSGSNCSGGTANSYTGSSIQFHGMTNTSSSIPIVPILTLQKRAMGYESANLSGSQSSQQIVGGQVGIQARYVDINATISSGQATTRTLTIGSGLNSWLATHYCASHTCTSLVDIPVSYLTSNGGALIRAKYDFVNQRVVTDDVNASGGGFVYIKGGVISTNPLGNIRVNNGYGQVTINNLSNAQLQLGNIDTGNGSVGIVQIVDTLKPMVAGQYATTWYVDSQGQGLSTFDNRNGASTLAGAYLVSTSSGNTAQYNPKNGIRYQWVRNASLSRAVDRGDDHFFMGDWVWNGSLTSSAALNGSVVDGNGNTSVYQRDITGSIGSNYGQGVAYHGCGDKIGSNCNWDFKATGRHDDGRLYGGWLYLFPTFASITVTQSVKADNPFNISFVGNATGSINASTTGNLIVAGNLNNPGGTTTLSGGNLSTLGSGSIYAHDLVLNAGAAIGSADAAFAANLAQGGSLAATSGNAGIYLNLGSGALIKALKAANGAGDVVVNAVGNLLAASTAANRSADVIGRNITLNSATGGIGESGNALRINAVEIARGGVSQYGIVSAKANKSIYLQETTGDMWVGQIASDTADVWVKVDTGSLYDAGRRGNQALDDTAQQAIWRKLSLTDEYGAASNIVATSVKPFQDQVNANYREYWSLLELGSVQSGEFQLSQAGKALYRPMVALKLGIANPTDAQVASYAGDRYSALVTAFTTDVGNNWHNQSAFQAYNASFSYTATAAQVATLSQDAVWTEAELLYAINQNAIDGSASSAIGSSEPNISGRNVSLQVAGNVGQLADSLNVSIDELRKGSLTATQAAALAVATAPGDVRTNKNANGDIVSLTVNRTLPFYVNATGQFDLDASGSAFLQSQPDMQVGTVSVNGDARLASAGSILAATGGGNFQIGRNLTLQANSGSLGTAGTTPVALNLNVGGALLAASAGQDVAINWLNGDFAVGQVIAKGDVYLNADTGSLLQQGSDVAVSGRNIKLNARDTIGRAGGALQVEQLSAAAGVLSGSAGQGIWLTTEKALSVGSLSAGQGLSLTSTSTSGLLSADSLSALSGDLRLDSQSDVTLRSGQASGQALLSSLGNVILGERFKGSSLAYVNSQGSLTLGNAAQLEAVSLQLRSASLLVGQDARLSGTDVDLNVSGASQFGKASRIDAGGRLTLGHGSSASGNLTLGEEVVFSGASLDLQSANLLLGNAAQLLASGALNASASSLSMGSNSLMQAGGKLSLTTTGDMTLGQLVSKATGGTLFDLDVGGQLSGNGDGATNLLASNLGEAFVRAGQGIGRSTRALTVKLPKLTTISTAHGDLFLTALQDLQGTTFEAERGNLVVNANAVSLTYDRLAAHGSLGVHGGNLDVGHLQATTGALSLDGLGQVSVGSADVGGVAGITAADVTLGRFDSTGSFTAVTSGDYSAITQSTGGDFSLHSRNATFGSLTVAGTTGMTLTQDLLGLGLLKAGADWNLSARNADVTAAQVEGNVTQTLSGNLDQDELNGEGNWILTAVNATVGEADFKGAVRQTVTGVLSMTDLKAGGSWSLTSKTATVTRANVTGAVDMTQTGLLTLGTLLGASTWTLDGTDASIGDATIAGQVNTTLTGNLQRLASLDGQSGWTLHAVNADIGRADLKGAVQQTLTGALNMASLKAGGLWNLASNTATVTQADVTGAVDMTQTGLLTLGTLLGGSTWTLNGTDASIGNATVNGQVNTTLSGSLLQLTNLLGQSGWTLSAVNADIGSADLQGNVLQTVTGVLNMDSLATEGLWTLKGQTSTIGSATVDKAVAITQTGLLTLTSLTGKDTLVLEGTDAVIGNAAIADTSVVTLSGDLKLASLTSGDDATVHIGSGSDLGSLDVTGDLDLNVAGVLDLDSVTSTGNTVLHHRGLAGTALRYGDLQVGGSLAVTGLGNWTGHDAAVEGDATYDVGSADLHSLVSNTGKLSLDAVGLFAADVLNSRTRSVVLQAGSADLGAVNAGTILKANTNGNLTIASGRSVNDLTLTTTAGSLGTIAFGELMDPNAPGVLDTAHLRSGENLYVETDGDVFGGNAEAEYLVSIKGRNMTFGRVQSLQEDVSLIAGGLYEEGNGNIIGLLVEGKRDVGIIAGGNLTMPEVKFGRKYSLKAGRDLTVGIRGDLNVNGLAEAGRDLLFAIGGSVDLQGIKAGRNVDVTSGGFINLDDRIDAGGHVKLQAKGGDVTVGTGIYSTGVYEGNALAADVTIDASGSVSTPEIVAAGGSIDVRGGNSLRIDALSAKGNIDLLAGGLIHVAGISRSGADQRWTAGSSIDFGRVLAGGSVDLKAVTDITGDEVDGSLIKVDGHSLRFTDLTSDTDTEMLARGLIRINGTSQSGGSQSWHADDSIFFERLLAGGQALLDSMLSTQGTVLRADQGARVNAGWRNGLASNADILLGQATAPTLSLWAGNLIRVADASLGQSVDLHGQDIQLYGRHTGSGQLNLWVEGSGQALAKRFDTRLQAADIVSPRLHVVDSRIETTGSKIDLQDAVGVDQLALYSAQAVIIADNTTPAYRQDADVQLYELDKAFQLKQDALTSTTSAYVLHRKSTHQVLVQNFSEQHAAAPGEGMLYQGVSASRYSEQNLSVGMTEKRIAGVLQSLAPVLPISSSWTPSWSGAPMETRMNLDMGAAAPADDGVEAWEL